YIASAAHWQPDEPTGSPVASWSRRRHAAPRHSAQESGSAWAKNSCRHRRARRESGSTPARSVSKAIQPRTHSGAGQSFEDRASRESPVQSNKPSPTQSDKHVVEIAGIVSLSRPRSDGIPV